MLTDHDISLGRASYALTARNQQSIADLFYDRLFVVAPQLRALFPADLAEQKGKLMAMVSSAIGGLDDARFIPALKAMGATHAGYGVTMEHYAIAGDVLLWTLQQALGQRFTLNIRSAWIKVYGIIAMMMVAGGAEVNTLKLPEARGGEGVAVSVPAARRRPVRFFTKQGPVRTILPCATVAAL